MQGKAGPVNHELPELLYKDVYAAYETGQKLHIGDHIYLVRPVPRDAREGLVLWLTDERTRGDYGLLFFPDGRVEAKHVR